jgi:hypothetical protein
LNNRLREKTILREQLVKGVGSSEEKEKVPM